MRYCILILLLVGQFANGQFKKAIPVYERTKEAIWVDSVYNNMTFDERVGQLFMVAAYSNRDTVHTNFIERLIKNYKVGGLIFFQGGPVRQAKLT
ncbi:MAG TPA: hypothetical protein VGB43_06120, partial [Flavobacterium sp.]